MDPWLGEIRQAYAAAWTAARAELLDRLEREPFLAPLAEALDAFLAQPGKALRPLLFLGAYRAWRPEGPLPAGLARAAAGLEAFHNFALVHDDLIDRSETRRGAPSLHRRLREDLELPAAAANDLALLAGDILFGYAGETLAEVGGPPAATAQACAEFARLAQQTGVGEAAELLAVRAAWAEATPATIERLIHLKTTRYTIEGPLLLGALLAGARAPARRGLEALAQPLGLAFQLENDLHEWDTPAAAQWDLAAGVKTLPLRLLWQRDEAARPLIEAVGIRALTPAEAAQLARRLRESGTREALAGRVADLLEAARETLTSHPGLAAARPRLTALLAIFGERLHHSEKPA